MIKTYITRILIALLFASAFAFIHYSIWALSNRALPLVSAPKVIHGFAYSGFREDQSPLEKDYPSIAELDQDLSILKPLTSRIRLYGALENTEIIGLAANHQMTVTAGAWIGANDKANRREIEALLVKIKHYNNIERAIIGNEALLREDVTSQELIAYLSEVKRRTRLPISTAEPWHIWLKHPELVKKVDFIAVHLLPYHEGLPVEKAVDYALQRYHELMTTYPRKKIVITEIGWPSKGPSIGEAVASEINQARFVREFLARVNHQGYDYYLMEAFDQPWKQSLEGWAGAYWGMFDADRIAKYSLDGAVARDDEWREKAFWSTLIGLIPIFLMALRFRHWRLGGRLCMALLMQACITTLVVAWALPEDYYYSVRDFAVLIALIIGMLLTSSILMIYAVEFSEVMFKGGWRRHYQRLPALADDQAYFVSIHLACYNEPPDMVIATIKSLEKLRYARFEVIVVDNNTQDEAKWQPIQTYMQQLPAHFKFFHLPSWPGFKAGALNFALTQTHADAQVIAVVDADYEVNADWLADLTPHFQFSKVAVVQAPQAHRDWQNNWFRRMSNWEFEGFFRIGMHHRHERNALIQHGTMTLVRRQALEAQGSWSEWCICEDTELGLRLLEAGYELRYVDETFGRGLTPADFKALKSQRFRWAFGAMQILKHHWSRLIGDSNLSWGQRYHFLTGWFAWLGDALQLIFTLGSLAWTSAMLLFPKTFSMPVSIMIIPILCFLAIKAIMGPVLYRKTMSCAWIDIFAASLTSLALSHAIAKGIMQGLIQRHGVFKVTAKGRVLSSQFDTIKPVLEEMALLLLLICGALAMLISRGLHNLDAQLWVSMLALQSLPYLSAVACQLISLLPDRQPKSPI